MNQYQDIDDGLNEFEDTQERTEAERLFKTQPHHFAETGMSVRFVPVHVEALFLLGPRTQDKGTPFDFESGYAKLVDDLQTAMEVRWSENGKQVDLAFQS